MIFVDYFIYPNMSWENKRPLSTAELLALLDEDEELSQADNIDAVIIPPDVDEVTDEEDIDDEVLEIDKPLPDVAGTFEIHTSNLPDSDDDTMSIASTSKTARISKKGKSIATGKSGNYAPAWQREHPTYSSLPQLSQEQKKEEIVNLVAGKTPYEVFSMYFTEELWQMIVTFSKKYADDHNRHSFHLDVPSLKRFFGILIFSGYHTLPAVKLYWSKDEDKGISLIRNCMSRNRFDSIKQNLHLSDNSQLNKEDKFSKLRPIFDIVNERNMQFGIFSANLSIDEEMVPYYGRHSCKMFIKGKPIRFGFKLWCLCSSDGYLYKFIPYGGKSLNSERNNVSLGEQVVLDLLSVVEDPSSHRIFFDNFFSSHKLFCMLHNKGFFATGTIRENRTSNKTLESTNCLKKKSRGSYDFTFDKQNEVLLVRWNDNSVVTVATNNGSIEPIVAAKRYNRKEKKKVAITQPNVIAEYNQHMGGVDLHDNGIANYRIRVRGKKWWWPLFINMLDSVIVNSWKIYRMGNEKISQLEFKSYIAQTLIKTEYETNPQLGDDSADAQATTSKPMYGRPSKRALSNELRYDNIGHIIAEERNKARRRCRQCKSTTIYICKKCQVHLHGHCFEKFHKNN